MVMLWCGLFTVCLLFVWTKLDIEKFGEKNGGSRMTRLRLNSSLVRSTLSSLLTYPTCHKDNEMRS